MTAKQLPLPGFEEETPVADMISAEVLLYLAHLSLRDTMRQYFDSEISVLREMGRLNDVQCPENIYLAQRKLCTAIKEVVIRLDEMNDAMEMNSND